MKVRDFCLNESHKLESNLFGTHEGARQGIQASSLNLNEKFTFI